MHEARAGGVQYCQKRIDHPPEAGLHGRAQREIRRGGEAGDPGPFRPIDFQRGRFLLAAAPQVSRVDQRISAHVQLGHEGVVHSRLGGLDGARREGEVGRGGRSGEVTVTARIHRNRVRLVHSASSQVGRVDQRRAVSVQLGDKTVVGPGAGGSERIDDREIVGIGLAGQVGVSGRVDGHALGGVIAGPAQKGGVDQRRAGRVHFAHEGVVVAAAVQALQHPGGGGEADRGRVPGDVSVAGGVGGDRHRVVAASPAQVGGVNERPGRIELGHKAVFQPAVSPVEGGRGGREVPGQRDPGKIDVAGGIHGDRPPRVPQAAPQECRVDDAGAGGVQLGHEHVAAAPERGLGRGPDREVGRVGLAGHVHRPGGVGGHTVGGLETASAQVAGVGQQRVDDERQGLVVGADLEAHLVQCRGAIAGGHCGPSPLLLLVGQRPVVAELAVPGPQHQVAGRVQPQAAHAAEGDPDRGWVGARRQHVIVFQLALAGVVDQVHAGVNAGVADPPEALHVRPPLGRIGPAVVVAPGRLFIFAGRRWRGLAAHQVDPHQHRVVPHFFPARWQQVQRTAVSHKQDRVPMTPGHELHRRVRLSQVRLEAHGGAGGQQRRGGQHQGPERHGRSQATQPPPLRSAVWGKSLSWPLARLRCLGLGHRIRQQHRGVPGPGFRGGTVIPRAAGTVRCGRGLAGRTKHPALAPRQVE